MPHAQFRHYTCRYVCAAAILPKCHAHCCCSSRRAYASWWLNQRSSKCCGRNSFRPLWGTRASFNRFCLFGASFRYADGRHTANSHLVHGGMSHHYDDRCAFGYVALPNACARLTPTATQQRRKHPYEHPAASIGRNLHCSCHLPPCSWAKHLLCRWRHRLSTCLHLRIASRFCLHPGYGRFRIPPRLPHP